MCYPAVIEEMATLIDSAFGSAFNRERLLDVSERCFGKSKLLPIEKIYLGVL
jgi:hypothetical protein